MKDVYARLEEDFRLRGLSDRSRKAYLGAVRQLERYSARPPDELGDEEVRGYFLHLIDVRRVSPSTVNQHLYAIKFLYRVTLKRELPCLATIRPKRRRNRSCPKCRHKIAEDWLEARRGEILPVTYFHAVFTLPSDLRRLVRSHQRLLGGILMRAAARATIKLGRDTHYVGGTVGVMAVLHTSGRNLSWHPHVPGDATRRTVSRAH